MGKKPILVKAEPNPPFWSSSALLSTALPTLHPELNLGRWHFSHTHPPTSTGSSSHLVGSITCCFLLFLPFSPWLRTHWILFKSPLLAVRWIFLVDFYQVGEVSGWRKALSTLFVTQGPCRFSVGVKEPTSAWPLFLKPKIMVESPGFTVCSLPLGFQLSYKPNSGASQQASPMV